MIPAGTRVDLSALIELSHDLMVAVGADGLVTYVNPAWTETFGWRSDQLVGTRVDAWVHPDDHALLGMTASALAAGEAIERVPFRVRDSAGAHRWVSWSAVASPDRTVHAVGTDETVERDLAAELQARELRLTFLITHLNSRAEEQRDRLAGAIHDGVLQELVAARILLDDHGHADGDGNGTHGAVEAEASTAGVGDALARATVRLRELLHAIVPIALENQELGGAIRGHLAGLDTGDVELEIDLDELPDPADRPVWLVAYRSAVEAVANALSHAGARKLRVYGAPSSSGGLLIEVVDDGAGFDVQEAITAPDTGEIGLTVMQEHVRIWGGQLELRSSPGAGAAVRIELPLTAQP